MSVQNTPTAAGATQVPETTGGVYASLFEKINLHPVDALDDIDAWQDSQRLADASADERVTAAVRVFLERLKQSGQQVEKLDKTLLDHHIAELDRQISRQLDTVMHHPEFQQVESLWRGLKHLVERTDYAQHHGVHITDDAVKAAVTLSRRYLTGRQLPDKAVDLLDTASARVRMSLDTVPEPLTQRRARISALAMEKQALLEDIAMGSHAHSERLAEIEEEEVSILTELDVLETQYGQEIALTEQLLACRRDLSRQAESASLQSELAIVQQGTPLLGLDVDARTVATVIADWTGVPLSSLMKDEQTELLSLEQRLAARVVGQDAALEAIAQRLRASKTGLASENGPQGVFLLTGPSGTGKTETALALADTLYGGEKSLITINLSEYQEPHTVSQLKGSPPGYVGYGQGGILTEAVRKRPYPGVNSSWHLAWQAPDGRVLNYTLRTEAGEGPLALLRLRHFTLPDNIFIVSASDAMHDDNVGDDEPSF
ncbi:AAA family ATPase [Cronobacter sakazakii]|nr:AAA family ATPase [Cronobacter sakazakii]ELY2539116.1 AAA family ATPase [Cronobacter sakazakii]ELY4822604.1 AAA family ATPase [Cronobacter sakazakii]ELY4838295.1 AAA family ATPase [Cronobacter sakazakii]ELY5863975.1 AAA family ATPase [Cronobacter sakazakii]